MNRYWLFSGQNYYPSGGMEDFKESSDRLEHVKEYITKLEYGEWAHIYDMHESKIVLESECLERVYEKDEYIGYKFIWKNID